MHHTSKESFISQRLHPFPRIIHLSVTPSIPETLETRPCKNGQIPLLAPFTILVMLSIFVNAPILDTAVPLHKKGPQAPSHWPGIDPWGTVVYSCKLFYRGSSF